MENIWRKIFSSSPPEAGGVLLIESVDSNVSLHLLCVYAYIITRAKNLTPVFLTSKSNVAMLHDILERYFDKFQVVEKPTLTMMKKLGLMLVSCIQWSKLFIKRNLVALVWKEQLVGDIIYDQYLVSHSRGTVSYCDVRLAKTIYNVICAIEVSRQTLSKVNPDAVLRSHQVGLSSSPLAIACEEAGKVIYSIGGKMYGTLIRSRFRKDYYYTATHSELAPLLDLPYSEFNNMFDEIKEDLFLGKFNPDTKLAFANKIFTSRSDFASTYRLDVQKKNIFIMLHAFTDYPQSHFNGMLFKDYLDWFLQTIEFVSKDQSVNWIIKQHPSSEFYPTKDFDWSELALKYSTDSLSFIMHNDNFDSRSICNVGDAVVTCVGTAGFEFSALCGIPSITAGDNPYANSGFAIYPRSDEEYFDVLGNIRDIKRLSGNSLRRAKATFMFIHRLSRVPMHAIINLSHSKHREIQDSNDYFDMAEENAINNESKICGELANYIAMVKAKKFRALRTSCQDFMNS